MTRLLLSTVVVAAALAGCGGDDPVTSSGSATPAPAPSVAAETPTPTATETATATATATPTMAPSPTASPESQPGGAGDEEAIRVPVELTISADGIAPPRVSVPAFFRMQFIVHNNSADAVQLSLAGRELLTVAAGETAKRTVPGRKKGSYVISTGTGAKALLVTGAEPGP